jgi:hypothetical protein
MLLRIAHPCLALSLGETFAFKHADTASNLLHPATIIKQTSIAGKTHAASILFRSIRRVHYQCVLTCLARAI